MGSFYRLRPLGFALESGARHVPARAFAPIECADDLIGAAEAKAAEIVADATAAYEAEKRRGYAEGQEAARLEAIEGLLREQIVLDASLRKIQAELAALVVSCVQKLVDGFDDASRAEAILRSALKKMREEKRIELKVPPALHARFRACADEVYREFPQIELIDVVEDPSLEGGHIIIQSSIGRIDGDMAHSLDALADMLRTAGAKAAGEADEAAGGSEAAAFHEVDE